MKTTLSSTFGLIALSALFTIAPFATAQTTQARSITSIAAGVVSDFGQQGIDVTSARANQPVRYVSNAATQFVDDVGNPISVGVLATGLEVTVYYSQTGNLLIASKVVVKGTAGTAPQIQPAAVIVTSISGVVSDVGREGFIMRAAGSVVPFRYLYTPTTVFLDERGPALSVDFVKVGSNVLVYYTKVDDILAVSRIIIRRAVPVAPVLDQAPIIR
jgi:hypothetical protein